jgi:4-aminobutyrate--pyruvate transaminase
MPVKAQRKGSPVTNYTHHLKALDVQYHLHSQTSPAVLAENGPLMLTGGEGVYVSDVDGAQYLEAMSGLWYANLGFDNARLIDAAHDQLNRLPAYHTFNARSNDVCARLAEQLAQIVPMDEARMFFVNSGSEAIDTMVKAAWYYHVANGQTGRRKIIARDGAFHGSSIFGAIVGGLPHMKEGFNLPQTDVVNHVSCPSMFRDARDGESEEAYCGRLIAEVADVIETHGADSIAAMIAEPIIGAGGVLTPPAGYFEKLSALLKSHGILLLMDEVICGFGRTGNWFGSDTYNAAPDMIAMAKGLTAGYIPLGAVAIAVHVYDAIAAQSDTLGVFGHGYTYSGHPTACAVALAAVAQYVEMDAPAVAAARGADLKRAFADFADDSIVGDIRIEGFIAGVELVVDKAHRRAFPRELYVGRAFERHALAQGLIVRNMGDTIAICPPYIMSDDEFGMMVSRFGAALELTKQEISALA